MSDRLTDAALVELEDIARLRPSKAEREAGMRLDGQAAIAVRDQAAKCYLTNLVIELRERRAADLSSDEVDALRWVRTELRLRHKTGFGFDVLDKLITAHETKTEDK